jgi:hypothetical protein
MSSGPFDAIYPLIRIEEGEEHVFDRSMDPL